MHHAKPCLALLLVLCLGPRVVAQDDDEDVDPFRPGVIGTYSAPGGVEHTRLDAAVNFVWGNAPPDRRLPPGKFQARWQGRLFTIEPGAYRLHVYAAGKVQLRLKGQTLIETSLAEPAWHAAQPVELTYGYHELEVAYEAGGTQPRLSLFWEGPKFQLEPLPDRHLFHDPKLNPHDAFAAGERLTRALRCGACHPISGEAEPLPVPALSRLRGNINADWLVRWLAAGANAVEASSGEHPLEHLSRRMPHYRLSTPDAEAVAAYLLASSEPTPKFVEPPDPKPTATGKSGDAGKPPRKNKSEPDGKPSPRRAPAEEGARLFATVGCLGCHKVDSLGEEPLFGGGDLTRVADKRPPEFFARWLADPAGMNPSHRMPVFPLSRQERGDLAAYLATLTGQLEHRLPPAGSGNRLKPGLQPLTGQALQGDGELLARGRQLVAELGCGNCHTLSKDQTALPKKTAPKLTSQSDWSRSCLTQPRPARQQPGYALASQQAAAVRDYISNLHASAKPARGGQIVLQERNCVGCHARGSHAGIAPKLMQVVERWPELASELPALAPPALLGVGDKLEEEALVAAIKTSHPPRRPWLGIRMPRFDLSEAELKSLVRRIIDNDRIPPRPAVNTTAESKELLRIAGTRLVTADGFGCTSCHQIGQTVPQKVALNARGTDLSLLGTRIRREWYDRWVRNPARIVPRMEMPSIVAPVRGVLHERLDDQLAAVWHVLNEPGFNPPLPNPIRVVRAGNVPEKPEPPHVLTDVLEVGDKVYSRPLVIGLSNRHNVLFDLETGRLAEWWIGDTARQRTRGKSWYWEFGGTTLVQEPPDVVPIELVIGGKHYQPKASGQFVTEFDAISHSAENQGHIEFQHRLRYEVPGRQPISLLVNQHISRVITGGGIEGAKTSKSAFFRLIEIANVPPDAEVALTVQSPQQAAIATADRTINPGTHAVVTALKGARETPRSPHPLGNADPQVARAKGTEDGVRWLELVYSTNVPVDQYIPVPVITPPPVAARLHVVPGYEATRLPLAEEEMPIALEWREDGTLIVCSLKGRVLLARDIDGDGLEDQMHPFSEELAAPYGALAHNGAIDVIAKYGLLRLHDQDGDGRAERTEVLASGWGYTTDYHDWAVGLERDAAGNYYIALPCQQDNRTPAAAHLRGQGIKLAPRKPTQDNPHHYSLEPFCAGLRFPMGLALDRGGNLFATDNQGNYNPFNELNHLMPGKRYGFINKLEFKPDFKPATESPALEIPHPWTRSVNGICFLYTPAAVREKLGRDRFGAFEGHLIGCEYDTRRLVRMSLQPIGDTFQGAVYPFSVEPPKNGEPLQGPIACRVSPQGDLYIGNIRDSGWGGDRNVGSIVRLRPSGELPAGIAEVRATAKGFSIDFTQPVDRERAANRKNYAISLYRRISTPAYGGPDVDRQSAEVKRVDVSPDGRRVELQLDKLREGFVYELHLSGLVAEGELFHPAEAHFTLRKAP